MDVNEFRAKAEAHIVECMPKLEGKLNEIWGRRVHVLVVAIPLEELDQHGQANAACYTAISTFGQNRAALLDVAEALAQLATGEGSSGPAGVVEEVEPTRLILPPSFTKQ